MSFVLGDDSRIFPGKTEDVGKAMVDILVGVVVPVSGMRRPNRHFLLTVLRF